MNLSFLLLYNEASGTQYAIDSLDVHHNTFSAKHGMHSATSKVGVLLFDFEYSFEKIGIFSFTRSITEQRAAQAY